ACAGCSQTCTSGCCAGSTCTTPSVTACGAGGGACTACNPNLADRCTAGVCKCGSGAACAAGQVCQSGSCVCSAASCSNGCCFGTSCFIGVNCATCKSYHQSC